MSQMSNLERESTSSTDTIRMLHSSSKILGILKITELPTNKLEQDLQREDNNQSDESLVPLKRRSTKDRKHISPKQSALKTNTYEAISFLKIYLSVRIPEIYNRRHYKSLSSEGRLNHYIVSPWHVWHGQNTRTLTSASLAQIELLEPNLSTGRFINGGSHNYAGFYAMSEEDLELQGTCLAKLPVADISVVAFLHEEMLMALAKFWDASCCFSTSSGYQSNILGISAIAGKGWLIVLDEKSHNSIFTGAYAAGAESIKKFKHNDMVELRRVLENARREEKHTEILVIIEGLYSMDGTIPPLDLLHELKEEYGFVLYVDEAHSFGSIGRTGHGVLELWNDEYPQALLPSDLFDVRSAALSKAIGGLGGYVCGTSNRFEEKLRRQSNELQRRSDSLTTSTMLLTLRFLAQPKLLERNLRRLKDISRFCHEELRRQGVHIYGDKSLNHLPMLPVFGGRPSKAAELSYVLKSKGIVASPISTPAVEIMESRVRVILSPSYSQEDVSTLVNGISSASRQLGLSKNTGTMHQYFHFRQELGSKSLENERRESSRYLRLLLEQQLASVPTDTASLYHSNVVIEAGHSAQHQYCIGAGNARWALGTFQPHLEVEEIVVKIYNQSSAVKPPLAR